MSDRGRFRRRLFEILEIGAIDDVTARVFDGFMVALILLNVAAVVLETSEPFLQRHDGWLKGFEIFTVVVFTLEYAARLWVSDFHAHYPRNRPWKARLRYMLSPYALIDLAAILPFYLGFYPDLRVLRVFRLVRMLKLVRYSPALGTLGRVFYEERRALMAAGLIMLGLIVLSATVIYYLERAAQPTVFTSIPKSMWWAISTLTTVGYGDMTPVTPAGQVFGGLVMIFGLGVYALPVGIIASGFAAEIRRRDFVVTQDVLSRVPVFAELGPFALAKIAALLKARIFQPGDVVIKHGDYADSMCFILTGSVEIRSGSRHFRLGPGDFFGEIGLLTERRRTFTATAQLPSQIMMLEKGDFLHLIHANPDIGRTILQLASDRIGAIGPDGEALLSEAEIARARRAISQAMEQLD